ncbi:MAG: hypothetical protein K0U93_20140 [Gammaproteobacteria bacterium]|nr:hypothetical protein [Gammaproteobacteria bacterium]
MVRVHRIGIWLPLLACVSLTGCGVESASTAATVAKLKVEETKQAKQTLERTQTKIADIQVAAKKARDGAMK